MGARGPIPKPVEMKTLEGNAGKRQLNITPKVKLTEFCKKPPPYLGTYGKKEWKRTLPLLEKTGIITDTDYIAFVAYCQSVDTFIRAEKDKRANGMTIITAKGNIIQSPSVGIANTALTQILKFGKEFGLTPSSRQQFNVDDYEKKENPILSLLSRKKEIECG